MEGLKPLKQWEKQKIWVGEILGKAKRCEQRRGKVYLENWDMAFCVEQCHSDMRNTHVFIPCQVGLTW